MVFAYAYVHTYVPGTYGCVCPHRKQGGTWGEFCVASAGAAFPGSPRGASARVKPETIFHCNTEALQGHTNAFHISEANLRRRFGRICLGSGSPSGNAVSFIPPRTAGNPMPVRIARPLPRTPPLVCVRKASGCVHQHTLGRKTANCAPSDSTSCGRRRHPRRTRTPRGNPGNVHVRRRCSRRNTSGKPR
jgi:hypothetical protein